MVHTHHQRAHCKNAIVDSAKTNEEKEKLYLNHSFGDKAFISLGTSEGFRNTYVQSITQPTDPDNAPSLTNDDFRESSMTVTPGAHRIFTKSAVDVDGEVKLKMEEERPGFLPQEVFGHQKTCTCPTKIRSSLNQRLKQATLLHSEKQSVWLMIK